MLRKIKGVVLSQVRYGDSSIIAKIYTKEEGLQSYIIKGVKNKKKKVNFLQALFLVEIESYHKASRSMQFTKEIMPYYTYNSIPFDIIKSSIVLFIVEILIKTIKEEERNDKLFSFLESALIYFDKQKSNYANFHLFFIVHLTKYLGFFPNTDTYQTSYYFNLTEGCFTSIKPDNNLCITKNYCELFYMICNVQLEYSDKINIIRQDKLYLIEKLVDYYSIHIEGFELPKSLQILKEVFS